MSEPVGWFRALVYDAQDIEKVSTFWRAVLDVDVALSEPGWIALERGASGSFMAFESAESDNGTVARPDIEVEDLAVAQARVEALGGRLVKVVHAKPGETHLRMADPEGNEFMLVLPPPMEGT